MREEGNEAAAKSSPGSETFGNQPDSVGAKLAESAAAALPMITDPSTRDLVMRCLRSKDLLAESPDFLERLFERGGKREAMDWLLLMSRANVAPKAPQEAIRAIRRALIRRLGGSRNPELQEFLLSERARNRRAHSAHNRRGKEGDHDDDLSGRE